MSGGQLIRGASIAKAATGNVILSGPSDERRITRERVVRIDFRGKPIFGKFDVALTLEDILLSLDFPFPNELRVLDEDIGRLHLELVVDDDVFAEFAQREAMREALTATLKELG